MKSTSRRIEKTLVWIANIILISVAILMYTGYFKRQLEAIFLTPEFVRFSFSSWIETFVLYTRMEYYRLIEFFIIIIKLSALLIVLIALLATFTMKYRIFSGVLFLLLAIAIAGITSGVAVPVYLLYFIVAIMLFVRKG